MFEPMRPWADQRTPALAIVARGDQIRTVSSTRFVVCSQSRPGRKYEILIRKDRWSCTCAFFRGSHRTCIHILAIRYREQLGDPPDSGSAAGECPGCGSPRIVRFGRRHNRSGTVSRYLCRACGHRFTNRGAALRRRSDARTVAIALDLYFRGLSIRKVSQHLHEAHGLSVAPATIHGWIVRYGTMAARWMDSLGARTSERWHLDETVVTSEGHPRWVWNVLDAGTRFLIAVHVTKLRRLRDARVLLRRAKSATPDRPLEVFTDGLPVYHRAVGRELAFRSGAEVVNPHVRVPSIRAKKSNNLIERLHGTEKDRLKVLRGFHARAGARLFMEGFRVHYNLVRPHATLRATPGDAAGLPALGGFRWSEILRRASERVPRGQVEIEFVPTRGPAGKPPSGPRAASDEILRA